MCMLPYKTAKVKSYFRFHQSVFIAVNIQISTATKLKSCFGVAFRVELNKLDSVAGYIGGKGDVVFFAHRMRCSEEVLILNFFNNNTVLLVGFLSFKGRQSDAAAAYYGIPR